jgi:pimeloyl-ACP methyl ester carboxylesterase
MSLAFDAYYSGAPVVFLHGFCESKTIWADFIPLLSPSCRYLALDMPGFGESHNHSQFHSIEAMAEAVYAFWKEQQLEKALWVCHSLGGYVALALAEAHPEAMAGLCLFHSTAYPDSEERKNSRNKTANFIRSKGLNAFLENFVPSLFYKGRREVLAVEQRQVLEITSQTPQETAAVASLAMRDRPNRTHVLSQAAYPIMFIMGKEDELAVLENNKPQFFLPQKATIHLLAETGHMGMYERPKETALMVNGFAQYVFA